MRAGIVVFLGGLLLLAGPRSAEIPFRSLLIDNGASETAAVADVNKDGRLDIISGENWYEALPRSGSGQARWAKHKFRDLNYTSNYYDNFSDLPVDVDGDGYPDLVRVTWFAKKISWWRNPGRSQAPWQESDIHTGFNIEFAVLADIDNDGKATEVVAQENGTPQAWYEAKNGAWLMHVVSDRSYGHGIGAGDVNGDGRTDILTPRGWLEAPSDPRAGNWAFHPDWESINVALPIDGAAAPPAPAPATATPPRVLELGFMHVADVNGDGRKDLVTGKRYMAHNGRDPGEREPLGIYWYEYMKADDGKTIEWVKHVVDYGSRTGGGMQIPVVDIDGDGDADFAVGGKSGLFLFENLTKHK
ncbi:MAG: VCBS repeat-containing protein [Acidobacteriota bacterium]|nr:VCBS repeat-containing protein [Acidobacteriota bacterium]